MLEKDLQKNPAYKNLCKALAKLNNEKNVSNFLRDVCTLSELKGMSERLEVAKLIKEGMPYRKIYEKTGVSTATTTRVAHWLHHGMGGYELVLN